MITKEQFNKVVNDVPDVYFDFSYGLYEECVEEDILDDVYHFMLNNPYADTSTILEYITKLEGITEPYVIVDDDYVEHEELAHA